MRDESGLAGRRVGVIYYGGRHYVGTVAKVGRLRVGVTFKTRRGRTVRTTFRADDPALRWTAGTADDLTRRLTAFGSLTEMLDARGGYRPTIYPRDAAHLALRAAYDHAQRVRGDERRAYPPRATR